jgi:uncharacterized phage protein (predicted DNA packaging)
MPDEIITPVTPLALLKSQLNIDHNLDDALLTHKLLAAEEWIENHTGVAFRFNDTPVMTEAALQLAAYWYEQREAASEGRMSPAPFSVHTLLSTIRKAVTGREVGANG